MKFTLSMALVCVFGSSLYAGTISEKPLVLSRDGKTDWAVAVDETASDVVRFAAWDLARQLKRITDAEFRVVPSVESRDGKRIEVGTVRGRKKAGEKRMSALGHNGSLSMASAKAGLLLVGADDYGVVGAVYDFLEKQLGCRWYTPFGDERIPHLPTLTVKPFECTVNPPFESRWLYGGANLARRIPNASFFFFRNGMNMLGATPVFENVELPEGIKGLPCEFFCHGAYCHSLFNFIPPHDKREYFKNHPEWFTYRKTAEGWRRVSDRHLCFSNPELRREFAKNFLAYADKTNGRGVYDISMMDEPGALCECSNCVALVEKYGAPGAPLFCFVANVAKKLKARHPQALLSTLVYHARQTQPPPNEAFPDFPDNVVATFAPIDDDFSKDLSSPRNARTLERLRRWSKLVRRVWAWYYPAPYGPAAPYAGLRRTAADTRLMLEAGLCGTGYEHDSFREEGGNFYDLQLWLFTKLFRDPYADIEPLIREFCGHYYGKAAADVLAYRESVEKMREGYKRWLSWDGNFLLELTPQRFAEWSQMMDEAEAKVADDPKALQHVRELRISVDRPVLDRFASISRSNAGYSYSAEALRDRLTNTYARCAAYRALTGEELDRRIAAVQESYEIAMSDRLKPAAFKDVPDCDFRQSFTFAVGCGCSRRPEKDSVLGKAAWDDREGKTGRKDLSYDTYDEFHDKVILLGKILNADMVEGKFHFYKIGRVRLSPRCYTRLGTDSKVVSELSHLYEAGDDSEWDYYVSMKFEGPQYFPKSTLKESRAVFDQAVLVRVKDVE